MAYLFDELSNCIIVLIIPILSVERSVKDVLREWFRLHANNESPNKKNHQSIRESFPMPFLRRGTKTDVTLVLRFKS